MLKLISSAQIPLIRVVDVLILDGGLAGLEAARSLSGRGAHVLLVESSTYLGGKITKTQRPWIEKGYLTGELTRIWLPAQIAYPCQNHSNLVIFGLDDMKRHFEDVLLSAKVEFLYASRPVDAYLDGSRWIVIIGNKSGRQAISARVVIDNSDQASLTWASRDVAELSEFEVLDAFGPTLSTATISFSGLMDTCSQVYSLPEELGVYGNRVCVVQGGIAPQHGYVEFQMYSPDNADADPVEKMQKQYFKAYETGFDIAEFLVNNLENFKGAEIGVISREVLYANNHSYLDELTRGRKLAETVKHEPPSPQIVVANPEHARRYVADPQDWEGVMYRDDNEIRTRSLYPKIFTRAVLAPLLMKCDVCVSGGGTSGAIASMFAARQGVDTVVVDMNPVLGGTGTIGGVHTHWMSSGSSVNDEIDERVKKCEKRLGIDARYSVDLRVDEKGNTIEWFKDYSWNKEVKAHVLHKMNREAGVKIFTHCLLIGTLLEGNKVLGTVYVTPFGLRCVLSEVTIDATGDGDVAAFAGAEYVFGAKRDRYAMWTSMAEYVSPEKTLNNFTSPADVGDVSDYTRFIIASRRRSLGKAYDHVEYVAPRETRHILGEYTVTLKDQLLQKSYSDTVAVFYSNYDLRGRAFADIVLFGLMPPNLDIEIPYRALLPKSLENIIIAGKAYSITHDALSSARMQRDMQQLGACVAVASALAIQAKVPIRTVSTGKIRQILRGLGILPPRIHEKRNINTSPNLQEVIDNLQADERMEWLLMGYWERAEVISPIITLCYAGSQEVVPLLLKAHKDAKGRRRLLLARLLLWHRNDAGIDDVIRTVYEAFDEEYPLPRRKGDIYWTTGSPDQGIMPEVLYLIYPLARSKSEKVHALLADIVDLIQISERDYADRRQGSYDYIDCVAYVAERQPNHAYIPLLKKLLDLPELQNTIQPAEFVTSHLQERLAYLSLSLYRALARCGSTTGLAGLAAFLEDNRAYLSKSAHDELMEITSLSLPMDISPWATALAAWPDAFEPVPLNLEFS